MEEHQHILQSLHLHGMIEHWCPGLVGIGIKRREFLQELPDEVIEMHLPVGADSCNQAHAFEDAAEDEFMRVLVFQFPRNVPQDELIDFFHDRIHFFQHPGLAFRRHKFHRRGLEPLHVVPVPGIERIQIPRSEVQIFQGIQLPQCHLVSQRNSIEIEIVRQFPDRPDQQVTGIQHGIRHIHILDIHDHERVCSEFLRRLHGIGFRKSSVNVIVPIQRDEIERRKIRCAGQQDVDGIVGCHVQFREHLRLLFRDVVCHAREVFG